MVFAEYKDRKSIEALASFCKSFRHENNRPATFPEIANGTNSNLFETKHLIWAETRETFRIIKDIRSEDYMYNFHHNIEQLISPFDVGTKDHDTKTPYGWDLIIEANSILQGRNLFDLPKNDKKLYLAEVIIDKNCEVHHWYLNNFKYPNGNSSNPIRRIKLKSLNYKCGKCKLIGLAQKNVDINDAVDLPGLIYRGSCYERILIQEYAVKSQIHRLGKENCKEYVEDLVNSWGPINKDEFNNPQESFITLS